MVELVWAGIAASTGLLCYLAIPFVATALPIQLRDSVAQYYYGLATRAIGRMVLVKRTIGEYKLMKMQVDDEKAAAKVTLDDSLLGDKKELHFDDPDNRIHRWNNKPVAMIHELVNGAMDLQLAELGHHWRNHKADGKHKSAGRVNPHFEVDDKNRLVDLDAVMALVVKDSEPSDIGATEDWTRKRYEKYKDSIGGMEVLTTFTGFAVGLGGIILGAYVQSNLLDGTGTTGSPENPIPTGMIADSMQWLATGPIADAVVTLL
jgi:hypothetical protein